MYKLTDTFVLILLIFAVFYIVYYNDDRPRRFVLTSLQQLAQT